MPAVDHPLIDDADTAALKVKVLASGLSVSELVGTAWASASQPSAAATSAAVPTVRASASPLKRTGRSTRPEQLAKVLKVLERIQFEFNQGQSARQEVSLADLIVLAGNTGKSNRLQRQPVTTCRCRSRRAGRTASQTQTDVEAFEVLEPIYDGFRNYQKARYAVPAEALLIDKAQLLTLTPAGVDSADRRPACDQHQRRRLRPRHPDRSARRADERLFRPTSWIWERSGKRSSEAKDVFEGRSIAKAAP